MLFVLFHISISAIYGFDFGSQNVRVAVGVPGKPIEIQISEQGFRSTPNFLAYSLDSTESNIYNAEWFTGSEAERIIYKNTTHGVQNPFHYLNHPQDFTMKGADSLTASSIAFMMHLPKFKRKHDKLVVAVPSDFSPQARKNVIESLKLLNITSSQILNSNTALAAYYSIERLKKAENLSQKTLFIDIGAVQAEISLWRFERTGGSVKLYLDDYRMSDQIGGNKVDEEILKYVMKKIPREPSPMEMRSILRSIRKAKARFASTNETIIDLSEDFHMSITITNDEVALMCDELNNKLRSLLDGMSIPEEVELIGGSTRLPCFVNEIQKAFPSLTLKRSMNSEEAVAIGAAYYASLQTGTVAGARLDVIRKSLYGLDFEINQKKSILFKPGEIADRRSITIRKFDDFNFTLYLTHEQERVPHVYSVTTNVLTRPFTLTTIYELRYLTRNVTSQLANGTKPFIRLTFGLSQTLDCIDFISAALTANVTVNMTIKGEVNSVDSTSVSWGLKSRTELHDPEYKVNSTESYINVQLYRDYLANIKQHAAARHKIEAFIIDLNDKITYDEDFSNISTNEERFEIQQMLSRERQSVDISGSRVSAIDLERRLEKIKEKLAGILHRYDEFKQRPRAIKMLNGTIQKAENAILSATTDQESIEEFKKYLQESKDLIESALKTNPMEAPSVLCKELINREKRLSRKIPDLKSPPRKPKSITISNDPKSPDYSEEKLEDLEKMGIHISRNNEEATNKEL